MNTISGASVAFWISCVFSFNTKKALQKGRMLFLSRTQRVEIVQAPTSVNRGAGSLNELIIDIFQSIFLHLLRYGSLLAC